MAYYDPWENIGQQVDKSLLKDIQSALPTLGNIAKSFGRGALGGFGLLGASMLDPVYALTEYITGYKMPRLLPWWLNYTGISNLTSKPDAITPNITNMAPEIENAPIKKAQAIPTTVPAQTSARSVKKENLAPQSGAIPVFTGFPESPLPSIFQSGKIYGYGMPAEGLPENIYLKQFQTDIRENAQPTSIRTLDDLFDLAVKTATEKHRMKQLLTTQEALYRQALADEARSRAMQIQKMFENDPVLSEVFGQIFSQLGL